MWNNSINKISLFNANIIYFFCILTALIINIFFYYQSNFLDIIEILGTFIQIALPCYVLVPVLAKKDFQGAKQMIIYISTVLIITYILKYSITVKRPYGGLHSFPSGHTCGAFSGAVFLSYRYGKKYFFYSMPLASFVAFSRVYSHNHWLTDIAGSIILCFVLGVFLIRKYKVLILSSND